MRGSASNHALPDDDDDDDERAVPPLGCSRSTRSTAVRSVQLSVQRARAGDGRVFD